MIDTFIQNISEKEINFFGGIEEYKKILLETLEGLDYEILERAIVFKWPDTVCTDVYGATTNITDLYFQLRNEFAGNIMYARRMSATKTQIARSYCHSHIYVDGLKKWTSSICTGASNLSHEYFLVTLIKWLAYLPEFVAQESTNTRPYVSISGLNNVYSSSEINIGDNYLTLPQLLLFLPHVRFRTKHNNGLDYVVCEIQDNESFELEMLNLNLVGYHVNGRWYKTLDFERYNNHVAESFKFKGKDITFNVLDKEVAKPPTLCLKYKEIILTQLNQIYYASC